MVKFNKSQIIIDGVSLNFGIAYGQAYVYDHEYKEDICFSALEKEEIFHNAIKKALEISSTNLQIWKSNNRELIFVQKALLRDVSWQQRVIKKIHLGISINEALSEVLEDLEVAFGDDIFWQSRFHEIKGITQLVLQCLTKKEVAFDKTKATILCTRTISPVEMLQFDQANFVGLIVEDNSFLSHGMIIARSRKIPVVGGVSNIKEFIDSKDELLIDGDLGRIYVRPLNSVVVNYDNSKKSQQDSVESDKIFLISRDGIKVHLSVNANINEDLDSLRRSTIQGVGLYRTEMPFMMSERWPDVETQTRLYLQIMNKAKEKFVIFRALDISGDKVFKSIYKNFRDHQKIGWNNSRFTMQRPSLIRLQLRAMIRARAYCNYPDQPLCIMFPMIAEAQEILFVRSLMEKELIREKGLGHNVPSVIKIGAMVEVPSIVFQLDQLLDTVDFISIGSNDLFQFFFAIDRSDAVMSRRYDILSRPFMQMLKTILDQAKLKKIPVSLCGEMASSPLEAIALLGIGLRHFSVNPSAIVSIENMIKSLDIWSAQDCMNDCLSDSPYKFNRLGYLNLIVFI